MKYKLLFTFSILTSISFAQDDIKVSKVDSDAVFPNGFAALYQKIKETLIYPQSAEKLGKQGKVFIEFVISAEGYIIESSVKSIKTFDEDCARSAETVLKSIKTKWTPAKLNGLPTRQKIVIPIVFSLDTPPSSSLQLTDDVVSIKAIVIAKIGTPKKKDWAIYSDISMNQEIGSVSPGDSVTIINWGPWLYKIKSNDNEGYVSWKAVESKEDLSSIKRKIELNSDDIEKKLWLEDSIKNLQAIVNRNLKDPVLMDSTQKVFFKVSTSKNQMIVGDCSVIEFALFISYRNDLRLQFYEVGTAVHAINSTLSSLSCWYSYEGIKDIKAEDTTLNNHKYTKYVILRGGLCGIDPSKLTIPTLRLNLIKYKDKSDNTGTLVFLKSKTKTIDVSPIPQTLGLKTSDLYSPVGNFILTDSISKSNSFTYSLTIQGSGFLFPLKPPKINSPIGVGVLLKTEYSDTIINKVLISSKTFHYTLAFDKPGDLNLSESIRFSFYNPKLKKVYNLKSTKFLNIEEGNVQSAPSEIYQKDKIIVMDVSQSMMIEDYSPNRLSVVKLGVGGFLKTDTSCDIDIVIFGGQALRLQPGIKNRCYSNSQVQNINFEDVEKGTAIGNGIFLAIQLISESQKDKKIVIIGDGDNTAGQVPINVAIRLAKQHGIKVYSIGIGNQGVVPFGKGSDGTINYIDNTFSDLDLKKIALETGGKYFWAKDSQSISSVLNQIFE